MSNTAIIHEADVHAAPHDAHHEHHHHETFISKYVFSQDHKMIAKQFLITGMTWAIIGGLFSVCFACNWVIPTPPFPGLKIF